MTGKATIAPTLLTEEAALLLYQTHADHLRSLTVLRPPAGRIRASGTRLGSHDPREVSRQSCWLRLISTVEAYVDLMSSDMLREGTRGSDELVSRLVEMAEAKAASNWEERKDAFKNFHGVSISTLTGWEKVGAAIPVRNAIAHGLGSLTPRQRNRKTVAQVRKLGVAVVDSRVNISENALLVCRDNCVRFVRAVDQAAR